jgi:hypothetical protein
MIFMSSVLLSCLILIGCLYLADYEQAPIWEQAHVFFVGIGMIIGVTISLIS